MPQYNIFPDKSPIFQKHLKELRKKYLSVDVDLENAYETLKKTPRIFTRLPGYGDREVRHMRIKSTDLKKGKSSGFRLDFLIDGTDILPLCIYLRSNERIDEIAVALKKLQSKEEAN